jgi:hypothetical protein
MTTSRGGTLLGVLFLIVGLAVTGMVIIAKPIATIPLCIGIATALLGALMVNPARVKEGASDLGDIIGPYIPVGRSGRRDTDNVVVTKPGPPPDADK